MASDVGSRWKPRGGLTRLIAREETWQWCQRRGANCSLYRSARGNRSHWTDSGLCISFVDLISVVFTVSASFASPLWRLAGVTQYFAKWSSAVVLRPTPSGRRQGPKKETQQESFAKTGLAEYAAPSGEPHPPAI